MIQVREAIEMNMKYVALGMVFIFIGVAGLLYFHGMAIVQPDQGNVEAGQAKALTLLGLYMGMACLVVGAIGGALIGYAIYLNAETLFTESSEIKFCRYCGTENTDDALFCEKCGKKI